MEHIHLVIGNILQISNIIDTYIDKADIWLGILVAALTAVQFTTNKLKFYIPGKLVFIPYMILLIKHAEDWEFIRQWKHMQINKDNILQNSKQVYHDYKVGDKFILNNNDSFRY